MGSEAHRTRPRCGPDDRRSDGLSLRTMALRSMDLGPIAKLIFDVVAFGCQASSPALEPRMLDPAFTFTRPNRNHQAEITRPNFLPSPPIRPSSGPGNHANELTLRALFRSQVVETFAPSRALFWEDDAAGHVFHVLEGCLR